MAHDLQSGHSTMMATDHYAIGTDDLPNSKRYDVHFFMQVSESWFVVLGEESPSKGLRESVKSVQPSTVGQSLTTSVPATSNNGSEQQITTIVREITEVYTETASADLLPVSPATFRLLHGMRGNEAKFRSPHQAAALQTIISNPGYSYLVVLPTGGGKSDLLFLSALYERQNRRTTLLVVPYVALRHDIVGRATELGLIVVHWSTGTNKDSICTADIVVFSVESMDSGAFRTLFTELLIAKQGNSVVARIFFDEAHTILGHWD
ncbi:hypothetical protein V1505DRAFT_120094, partial [Lipomyces doorenjongii]